MSKNIARRQPKFRLDPPPFLLNLRIGKAAPINADADHFTRPLAIRVQFIELFELSQRRKFDVIHPINRVSPHLITKNKRVRNAPMQKAKRDRRIARMRNTPLPFHDDHFMMLICENLFLNRAIDKVHHDGIDRAPIALNHDTGLASGNEFGVAPASFEGKGQFHTDHHFPDIAIVPHRVNTQAFLIQIFPLRYVPFGILANIKNAHAKFPRGFGELRIVAEEVVEAGKNLHPLAHAFQKHGAEIWRKLAPGGRDADGQDIGAFGFFQFGDDGHIAEAKHFPAGFAGVDGIPNRDDLLGLIADQVHRRFAGADIRHAIGQYRHSSHRGKLRMPGKVSKLLSFFTGSDLFGRVWITYER